VELWRLLPIGNMTIRFLIFKFPIVIGSNNFQSLLSTEISRTEVQRSSV
jgi:hypothetical protein